MAHAGGRVAGQCLNCGSYDIVALVRQKAA